MFPFVFWIASVSHGFSCNAPSSLIAHATGFLSFTYVSEAQIKLYVIILLYKLCNLVWTARKKKHRKCIEHVWTTICLDSSFSREYECSVLVFCGISYRALWTPRMMCTDTDTVQCTHSILCALSVLKHGFIYFQTGFALTREFLQKCHPDVQPGFSKRSSLSRKSTKNVSGLASHLVFKTKMFMVCDWEIQELRSL